MKKVYLFIGFSVFSLIPVLLLAAGTPSRLTNNTVDDIEPRVSKNAVAWQKGRLNFFQTEIMLFDGTSIRQLTNDSEIDLLSDFDRGQAVWEHHVEGIPHVRHYTGTTTTVDLGVGSSPRISNGQIAWEDNAGIKFFDGNFVRLFPICCTGTPKNPQIDDGKIAWEAVNFSIPNQFGGFTKVIYLFDGQQIINISNTPGRIQNTDPQISNGQVVWLGNDVVTGSNQIYFYDGINTIQLTHDNAQHLAPLIHQGRIVWQAHDGQDFEIFFYDGGSIKQITNNNIHDGLSEISDGGIVWQGDNNFPKVFFYDGNSIRRLTAFGGHAFKPRIDGNIVVWSEFDGNDFEVISFDNSSKPPVILLPGLLGSWTRNFFEPFVNPAFLPQNRLEFTEDSTSSFWRQLDALGFLPHTWELLKTKLLGAGISVFRCPYDWRLSNRDIAKQYLVPCIDKAKTESGSSKVNIVAHSMGGIAARSYIQDDLFYRNDVDKLVMLGTPNHGSPKAYYPWEGADLFNGWFGIIGPVFEKAVGGRLTQVGIHVLRMASVQYMHSFFPSLQELLPTAPYLKDQFGFLRIIDNLVWQNPLLPGLNSHSNVSRLASSVHTKIFAGEGYPTLETIRVLYPNPDNVLGSPVKPYPDGLPIPLLEETDTLGDTTVLSQKSARITETNVLFEVKTQTPSDPESYVEHTNLPNAFFQEILSFLGLSSTETSKFRPTLPDDVLATSLASPANLLITDFEGRKLGFDPSSGEETYEIPRGIYSGRDDLELVAIINPLPGEYRVSIVGTGEGEFAAGITYAKDGCNGVASQDNFGQAHPGSITVFTLSLRGGCGTNAVEFFLPASVDIDPDTLNLKSQGNFVSAYIELPSGYAVENIDVLSITLNNAVSAVLFPTSIDDHNKNSRPDLMVKFVHAELDKHLTAGSREVILRGRLLDGTLIGGKDKLIVIDK